jgi:hypothetical protein
MDEFGDQGPDVGFRVFCKTGSFEKEGVEQPVNKYSLNNIAN